MTAAEAMTAAMARMGRESVCQRTTIHSPK